MNQENYELIIQNAKKEIETLIQQRKEIDEKIDKFRLVLKAFDDTVEQVNVEFYKYPMKATVKEKIVSILIYKKVVMTSSEIIDFMLKHQDQKNIIQFKRTVSGIINKMKDETLLKTYKPIKMKGYYYGNPKWFDRGHLLDEFKPNANDKDVWSK